MQYITCPDLCDANFKFGRTLWGQRSIRAILTLYQRHFELGESEVEVPTRLAAKRSQRRADLELSNCCKSSTVQNAFYFSLSKIKLSNFVVAQYYHRLPYK